MYPSLRQNYLPETAYLHLPRWIRRLWMWC